MRVNDLKTLHVIMRNMTPGECITVNEKDFQEIAHRNLLYKDPLKTHVTEQDMTDFVNNLSYTWPIDIRRDRVRGLYVIERVRNPQQ